MFIQAFVWSRTTTMRAHLYFSDRARDKAERNLSIATWASGVKSVGNRVARTTSMLWDRIYGKTQKTNSGYTATTRVWQHQLNFIAFTLKLAGSTLSWKAWSSLRFRSPLVRSSILLTASLTPAITVFPCFLTGAEPGLRSFQWEK